MHNVKDYINETTLLYSLYICIGEKSFSFKV